MSTKWAQQLFNRKDQLRDPNAGCEANFILGSCRGFLEELPPSTWFEYFFFPFISWNDPSSGERDFYFSLSNQQEAFSPCSCTQVQDGRHDDGYPTLPGFCEITIHGVRSSFPASRSTGLETPAKPNGDVIASPATQPAAGWTIVPIQRSREAIVFFLSLCSLSNNSLLLLKKEKRKSRLMSFNICSESLGKGQAISNEGLRRETACI